MTAVAIPASKITKADRDKYGRLGQPIPATKVYRAPFNNFSDKTVKAEKWVLVNSVTNTIVFANSYNGNLGDKYNLGANTRPMDGVNARKHAKRLKEGGEYELVSVSDCPFAVEAETINV